MIPAEVLDATPIMAALYLMYDLSKNAISENTKAIKSLNDLIRAKLK